MGTPIARHHFEGKVAVITGAGSGIGLGIARALTSQGSQVVIADIDHAAAQTAAQMLNDSGGDAVAKQLDVTDRGEVEKLADWAWAHFGHVDVLVNNAGVSAGIKPAVEVEEQIARWVLEVNLMGAWFGLSAFGRRFIEQGTPANILFTGSEHSLGMPHTGTAFYSASKRAVLAIADVIRHELPEFVTVSVLCPGVVQTNFLSSATHRQQRFGGPGPAGPKMGFGMDPDEVGRLAAAGMQRGDFYIVTHPEVRLLAEEFSSEVRAAFDDQFGPDAGRDQPSNPYRFTLHSAVFDRP